MTHSCPHCDKHCMSVLQKLCISPMNSVSCKSCGKAVSIPKKYGIWLIAPFLLLWFGSHYFELKPLVILTLGFGGAVVISVIQIKLIPLCKDEVNDRF